MRAWVVPLGAMCRTVNDTVCAPQQGTVVVSVQKLQGRPSMAWTTPTLVEICIGLEINGYLPAEF